MELGQTDLTTVVSGEARDTLDHPRGRLSTERRVQRKKDKKTKEVRGYH